MITYQDCVELSELTEIEIELIAEHLHMPEMPSIALCQKLMASEEGVMKFEQFLLEDIEYATKRGNHQHATVLRRIYEKLMATYPEIKTPKPRASEMKK